MLCIGVPWRFDLSALIVDDRGSGDNIASIVEPKLSELYDVSDFDTKTQLPKTRDMERYLEVRSRPSTPSVVRMNAIV